MCKPGSPYYEETLRGLIIKDKASTREIGGKGEKNKKGEKG